MAKSQARVRRNKKSLGHRKPSSIAILIGASGGRKHFFIGPSNVFDRVAVVGTTILKNDASSSSPGGIDQGPITPLFTPTDHVNPNVYYVNKPIDLYPPNPVSFPAQAFVPENTQRAFAIDFLKIVWDCS